MPVLAPVHRRVRDSGVKVALRLHPLVKVLRGLRGDAAQGRVPDEEIELVYLLPHLERYYFPYRPRVLPYPDERGENGVRVVPVEREKIEHVLPRRFPVALLEHIQVARRAHERLPLPLLRLRLEHEVKGHLYEPRHVLGALHVSRHPVYGIRYPAKHIS